MVAAVIEAVERIDVRERPAEHPRTGARPSPRGRSIPIEAGRVLGELIPNARFVELPGRDHAFWFGDQGTIAEEIEGFVTGEHPGRRQSSAPLRRSLFTDIVDSTQRAAELGDGELATPARAP